MSSPLTGRLLPWSRTAKPDSISNRPPAESETARKHSIVSSDEELLNRLRASDEAALSELFDRFGRLVFGIALRVIRDPGEAEEVVQDVFLQLLTKANRFDATKSCGRAWITRIAVHKSIDRRAFLTRRRFYNGTDLEICEDSLRGEEDIEGSLIQQSLIDELRKALEQLPAKQRITLEWAFFEGCNLQEVSNRLGDSYINVRHHFYRGLDKLRKSPFVTRLKGE